MVMVTRIKLTPFTYRRKAMPINALSAISEGAMLANIMVNREAKLMR